jgi:hypothetical protein
MRVAAIVSLLLLAACGNHETATTASTSSQPAATASSLTPEQLGELGAKIHNEPARADELLSQHGLTMESFEKAIRDVTENADASKRYAKAYEKSRA